MRNLPHCSTRRILALALAWWAMAPVLVVCTENATPSDQALEMFFKLGLPDSAGAKWVEVSGIGTQNEEPIADPRGYRSIELGNAWLVKEGNDGSVELIINQSEHVRARKNDAMAMRMTSLGLHSREFSALPRVTIYPADLDKAVEAVKTKFAPKKSRGANTESSDGTAGGRTSRKEDPISMARAVLFLAQLDRHGRGKVARELLPLVLAHGSSPKEALDSAVSLIANGRLAALSDRWIADGDSENFANRLEALAAEFSHGWNSRRAALLLARRSRAQTSAKDASDPATREAATLLLSISPENFRQIRWGANWLLPGINVFNEENPDELAAGPNDALSTPLEAPKASASTDLSPAPNTIPINDPVTTLLSRRRAAVAALAGLLGDRRLVRARRRDTGFPPPGNDDETDEAYLSRSYDALSRPIELGELAAGLLRPILPEFLGNTVNQESGPKVLAWLKEISEFNDDQIAWYYLSKAPNDGFGSSFRPALAWLINRGSEDTVAKLKEVFLDPALWQDDDSWELGLLESYLERLGSDRSAFQERLRKVYKAVLNEKKRQMEGKAAGMSDEIKEGLAANVTSQMQWLEYLMQPHAVNEMLAEMAAKDAESTSLRFLLAAGGKLRKKPLFEAEALIYQNAAKAKNAAARMQLLRFTSELPGVWRSDSSVVSKMPDDDATCAALNTLLNDETLASSLNENGEERSIALYTALAFLGPRLLPDDAAKYTALSKLLPSLAGTVLTDRARALLAGHPAPPWPDETRISTEKLAKLAVDFAAHPPDEIFSALGAMTPDEQVALAKYFAKAKELPPSLIAAQFTMASVDVDPVEGFDTEHWKDRRFNAGLVVELTRNIEKLAAEGDCVTVTINFPNQLGGSILSVRSNIQSISANEIKDLHLPGLNDKPAPKAVIELVLQDAPLEQRAAPRFKFPVWKDPAFTLAWRKKHIEANGKRFIAEGAAVSEEDAPRAGAAAFEKSLKAIFDHAQGTNNAFRLIWSVTTVEN